MTAYAMKPTFTDKEGYLLWMHTWKTMYKHISSQIIKLKHKVKSAQREYETSGLSKPDLQRDLIQHSSVARKFLTLREEAFLRRDRILKMHEDIKNQGFPLKFEKSDRVDFHFNKASNEFEFLPMWVVRIKGKSYYVNGVESSVNWKTHERETGSTKGVIRFPKCSVEITEEGIAKIH